MNTGFERPKWILDIEAKGAEAARTGKPRLAPYADARGGRYLNIITWNRARIIAWERGYDSVAGTRRHP